MRFSYSGREKEKSVATKCSKKDGTGIEIRSIKLKKLRGNKGSENVSGENNGASSSTLKK